MGAAFGLTTGAVAVTHHPDRVGDPAASAAFGLAVGAIAGLAGRPLFQPFGAVDVLAVALVGGAIGTQPGDASIEPALERRHIDHNERQCRLVSPDRSAGSSQARVR